MIYCACGCGKTLEGVKKIGAKYRHGHAGAQAYKRLAQIFPVPENMKDQIPSGLCECGCGGQTPICIISNQKRRLFRGYPRRFITGHQWFSSKRQPPPQNTRAQLPGEQSPFWKGGLRHNGPHGYIQQILPNGHRIMQHRLLWEKAHGKKLPKGWVIHHLNGIKNDNRTQNLLALPQRDHAKYLQALQARIRELEQLHLQL